MDDAYKSFTLAWSERDIEVRYQANWLNSGQWHIELWCEERLPVTETGYRSHFVPMAELADEAAIRAFVLAWLDEAAKSLKWRRYVEESRQLKLF